MSQIFTGNLAFILVLGALALITLILNKAIKNRLISLLIGTLTFGFMVFIIGNLYEYHSDPELWEQKIQLLKLQIYGEQNSVQFESLKQELSERMIAYPTQNSALVSFSLQRFAPLLYLFLGTSLYLIKKLFLNLKPILLVNLFSALVATDYYNVTRPRKCPELGCFHIQTQSLFQDSVNRFLETTIAFWARIGAQINGWTAQEYLSLAYGYVIADSTFHTSNRAVIIELMAIFLNYFVFGVAMSMIIKRVIVK